jgi:TetR/AcrR family transcriptional repressor of nem operon
MCYFAVKESIMAETREPARKRTNDPEGMRQRILDVAEQSFQERGYHATSLGDLMQAAGVTGGALHHHFATKKALGMAVIAERVAAAVEETWLRRIEEAPSAREGVAKVFAAVAEELERQGFVRGCPLNNLAHELALADADFRVAMDRIFTRWRSTIAGKARNDLERGVKNAPDDPELFAALAVATYSGAMSMAKTAQDAGMLRICGKGLLDDGPSGGQAVR